MTYWWYFFLFFPENRIWHFMEIVSIGDNLHEKPNPVFCEKIIKISMETICMKCQILFSGKNKKNIINLLCAEFAQRVVKSMLPGRWGQICLWVCSCLTLYFHGTVLLYVHLCPWMISITIKAAVCPWSLRTPLSTSELILVMLNKLRCRAHF